jgi:hypothetical protein
MQELINAMRNNLLGAVLKAMPMDSENTLYHDCEEPVLRCRRRARNDRKKGRLLRAGGARNRCGRR